MAMTFTRTTLGLVAASLALGAAVATPILAHEGKQRGQMHQMQGRGGPDFAAMDTDGDGSISAAERLAFGAARIAGLDSNGDGAITQAEHQAHAVAQASERAARQAAVIFAAMDADGNGVLTAAEVLMGAGMTRMLARLDTDSDGVISAAEQSAMGQMGHEARGEGHGRMGAHDGHHDADRSHGGMYKRLAN